MSESSIAYMTAIILLLVGFAIVATVIHRPKVWSWIANRRIKKTPETDSSHQTYGHPKAPVPYLHSRLPDPPDSYAWEIKVEFNEAERPALILSLIEVLTSEAVATKCADLICVYDGCYFADEYAEPFYKPEHYFHTRLIDPFLTWATKQVRKHTVYEQPSEYVMKTRDQ